MLLWTVTRRRGLREWIEGKGAGSFAPQELLLSSEDTFVASARGRLVEKYQINEHLLTVSSLAFGALDTRYTLLHLSSR